MRADPRSLRYRALAVVVAAVVLPLAGVWVAGALEPAGASLLRLEVEAAALEARDELLAGRPLEPVARRHRVRLRVLDSRGEPLSDVGGDELAPLLDRVSEPLYGPGGAPDPGTHEAALPPVLGREESRRATSRPYALCERLDRGLLLSCRAAVRDPAGRLVHAQRVDRRFVRSLYEQRLQLTALTAVVLVLGGWLALWVGTRMVRPIESLRDQVVERTRAGLSTRPVVLDRPDELGELATAFNQLLRGIDERDRANAAFAADLAHELKNPVAAVRAAAEALGSDRPLEAERRERLRRVLSDSSARMEVVVHQFLELARAEAGLPDRQREPVELLALCARLTEAAAGDERHAGVRFSCEGEALIAEVVPERLETAIRNLLSNAAHYAGAGGEVRVGVRWSAGLAELTVRDTGPGIPEADLPRVFDRYHTTREGGTGLGLALVKAIAAAHGGTAEAGRAEGGGAELRLRLPARRPPAAREPGQRPLAAGA